jgi:peptidyl-prolyl cis-trans isomerase SurA
MLGTGAALAQSPAPPAAPAAAAPSAAPAPRAGTPVSLDRVLVVVNDEAITQFDLNEQRRVVLSQLKASNITPPSADVLDKQVLERLIVERGLLQYAKDNGIRVDDTTVERTILRVAEENKLKPDEFRKLIEREGIGYATYREDIRRQVVVQRVREREVDSKVAVSDPEVDNYLATVAAQSGDEEYQLSHVYVTVPEQATPDVVAVGARARRPRLRKSSRARASRRSRRRTRMRRTHRRAATWAGARLPGSLPYSRKWCAR